MATSSKVPILLVDGKWNNNLSWAFYLDKQLPELSLCTSVYCLAIIKETDEIVLTHIKRGWEMLGGHIEPDESLADTLLRESLEEGGFRPEVYIPYGYIKVTAKEPVKNRHGGLYPLVSYIPHFIAITNTPLGRPTGDEVIGNGMFNLDEITMLNSAHEAVIRAGMEQYWVIKEALQAKLRSVHPNSRSC